MDIVELFNKKGFKIANRDWISIDKSLTNFKSRSVSIPLTSDYDSLGIDTGPLLYDVITNEINNDIFKSILSDLLKTNKFDYIDIRPDSIITTPIANINKLVSRILLNGYKNLITSSSIASIIQDNAGFESCELSKSLIPDPKSLPYIIGNISNKVSIYVDPVMRFNDARSLLFNEVRLNFDNFNSQLLVSRALAPRLSITYDFDFRVDDSKLIFLVDSGNLEYFSQYISIQRDIKISDILED